MQVKRNIERTMGDHYRTCRQVLVYNNKSLRDDKRLCDLGIKSGATFFVHLDLRGGGKRDPPTPLSDTRAAEAAARKGPPLRALPPAQLSFEMTAPPPTPPPPPPAPPPLPLGLPLEGSTSLSAAPLRLATPLPAAPLRLATPSPAASLPLATPSQQLPLALAVPSAPPPPQPPPLSLAIPLGVKPPLLPIPSSNLPLGAMAPPLVAAQKLLTQEEVLTQVKAAFPDAVGILTASAQREHAALSEAIQHAGAMSKQYGKQRASESQGMRPQVDAMWAGGSSQGNSELVRQVAGLSNSAMTSARKEAASFEKAGRISIKARHYECIRLLLPTHLILRTAATVSTW